RSARDPTLDCARVKVKVADFGRIGPRRDVGGAPLADPGSLSRSGPRALTVLDRNGLSGLACATIPRPGGAGLGGRLMTVANTKTQPATVLIIAFGRQEPQLIGLLALELVRYS